MVQHYLRLWDIEVNFRDEKTSLGIAEAQVRSEASNQNAPALAVAAYSFLRLDAVKAYGKERKPETFPRLRWHQRKPEQRATTNELINQLRYELWSAALTKDFRPFSPKTPAEESGRKCDLPLESAVFCSIKCPHRGQTPE